MAVANTHRAPQKIYPAAQLSRNVDGEPMLRYYRATGEFRSPRPGEYFLSGAIIEAHQNLGNVNQVYWIAEEVSVPAKEVILDGWRYRRVAPA